MPDQGASTRGRACLRSSHALPQCGNRFERHLQTLGILDHSAKLENLRQNTRSYRGTAPFAPWTEGLLFAYLAACLQAKDSMKAIFNHGKPCSVRQYAYPLRIGGNVIITPTVTLKLKEETAKLGLEDGCSVPHVSARLDVSVHSP